MKFERIFLHFTSMKNYGKVNRNIWRRVNFKNYQSIKFLDLLLYDLIICNSKSRILNWLFFT